MKNRLKYSLYILLLVFSCPSIEAQENLFVADCFKHATYGFVVVDLDTHKTMLSINADKSLHPASILKVVSTGTALLNFDASYQIETPISYSGIIIDGVLHGDLIIKGSGDPTFGSKRFPESDDVLGECVLNLKHIGIKKIEGNIVADISLWSHDNTPMSWAYGDVGNYYASSFSSLNYFENTYKLTLESGKVGDLVHIKGTNPIIPNLKFDSQVIAAPNDEDNAYIIGSPFTWQRQVVGTMPANRKTFVIKGAIPFPAQLFLDHLSKTFQNEGISIGGKQVVRKPYTKPLTLIYKHKSPALIQIVNVTNQVSHNFFAEGIAQQCILRLGDANTPEFSPEPILNFWEKKGVNIEGVSLDDCSGLSSNNLVTTQFMIQVLLTLYDSRIAPEFVHSLPIAGESGTLKSFLLNSPLKGKLKAKSGSISGVRSYAGYVNYKGKNYAFCIIVNNFSVKSKEMARAIGELLTHYFENL